MSNKDIQELDSSEVHIAIFIDPAVKAVHLELVSNLNHVPLLLSLEGLLHEGGIF